MSMRLASLSLTILVFVLTPPMARAQPIRAAYAYPSGNAWSASAELPVYGIMDLGPDRVPLDVNDAGTVLLWEDGNRLLRWGWNGTEVLLEAFHELQTALLNERGTVAAAVDEWETREIHYWMPGHSTPAILQTDGHLVGDPHFLGLYGLNDFDQLVFRMDASDNLFFVPERLRLETNRVQLPGETWTLLARYEYFHDIDFSLTQGGQVYNVHGFNNYADTVGQVYEGEDYAAPGEPSEETYDRQYYSMNIDSVLEFEPLDINDARTIIGSNEGPYYQMVILDQFGQRTLHEHLPELAYLRPEISSPANGLEVIVLGNHYFKRMSERDQLARDSGTPAPDFLHARLQDLIPSITNWTELSATCISRNGRIAGSGWRHDPATGTLRRHAFLLTGPLLIPDWDRDGMIGDLDRQYSNGSQPLRMWINDDDDIRDLARSAMDDLPGSLTPDWASPGVDGLRDGVDFFPLLVDLRNQLSALDNLSEITLRLRQADAAVNIVLTRLQPNGLRELHEPDLPTDFGRNQSEDFANATTETVTPQGVDLPLSFMQDLVQEGRGILLLEGRLATSAPLVLEVWNQDTLLLENRLALSVSPVHDMMRILNVRQADPSFQTEAGPWLTQLESPPNMPDDELATLYPPLRTLIHIHGYNWTGEEAPAAHAEVFKRFHQSGSPARFIGVSWHGDAGTISLLNNSFEYNANVTNAFITATYLRLRLAPFSGAMSSIFAHSLGNMVASSLIADHGLPVGNYFMVNAAVPLEAIDGESVYRRDMVHPDWKDEGDPPVDYAEHLLSTNWYRLFAQSDHRSALGWKSRFEALAWQARCLNFYSSGEDVLRTGTGELPNLLGEVSDREWVWVFNEMIKGTSTFSAYLAGEIHGGWGFNQAHMQWVDPGGAAHPPPGEYVRQTPAESIEISFETLRARPFFRPFTSDPDSFPLWGDGSWLYANEELANARLPPQPLSGAPMDQIKNHARILAEAIPAHSAPIGSQPVRSLTLLDNIDLDKDIRIPQFWPERSEVEQRNRWLHSDYLNPALAHVARLYQLCVEHINTLP